MSVSLFLRWSDPGMYRYLLDQSRKSGANNIGLLQSHTYQILKRRQYRYTTG